MCDCIPSTLPPYFCTRLPKSGFSTVTSIHRTVPTNFGSKVARNGGTQFINLGFGSSGYGFYTTKSSSWINVSQGSSFSSAEELGFMDKDGNGEAVVRKKEPSLGKGLDSPISGEPGLSGLDFLQFDEGFETKAAAGSRVRGEELVKVRRGSESDDDGVGLKLEDLDKPNVGQVLRSSENQLMNRSNMIAKQVISMQSALSLGFVSQLWVDTLSWAVVVVEVRPNLLSGELDRILLEDVNQVGDVVLIQDEKVMENQIKMVGVETLVGYNVVTPGRRNIGKVRGYTFNINSGAVESLELDSFGISVIPSSLVSTYALFVEDVLEVVFDTVVVHEAAASRIQRVTKGFWDAQKVGNSVNEFREYYDRERPVQSDYGRGRRRRSGSQDSRPKSSEVTDDWELPMDYL